MGNVTEETAAALVGRYEQLAQTYAGIDTLKENDPDEFYGEDEIEIPSKHLIVGLESYATSIKSDIAALSRQADAEIHDGEEVDGELEAKPTRRKDFENAPDGDSVIVWDKKDGRPIVAVVHQFDKRVVKFDGEAIDFEDLLEWCDCIPGETDQ